MAEEEERTGRNLIACLARHVQSPPSSCRQHQTIFRRIFFGTQHDIKTGSEQTLFIYLVVAKNYAQDAFQDQLTTQGIESGSLG